MYRLNEDAFSEIPVVETEIVSNTDIMPEGPAQGPDTGIANIIHDLIIDENEAIQGYNNAIANLEARPELIPIFQDIANEEMNHIGMLEVALEMISPNADEINAGEVEAEETLDTIEPEAIADDFLSEDTEKKSNRFKEDLKESIYIPDDYKALRVIDRAIASCPSAKDLSEEQREDIIDCINNALHEISQARKMK